MTSFGESLSGIKTLFKTEPRPSREHRNDHPRQRESSKASKETAFSLVPQDTIEQRKHWDIRTSLIEGSPPETAAFLRAIIQEFADYLLLFSPEERISEYRNIVFTPAQSDGSSATPSTLKESVHSFFLPDKKRKESYRKILRAKINNLPQSLQDLVVMSDRILLTIDPSIMKGFLDTRLKDAQGGDLIRVFMGTRQILNYFSFQSTEKEVLAVPHEIINPGWYAYCKEAFLDPEKITPTTWELLVILGYLYKEFDVNNPLASENKQLFARFANEHMSPFVKRILTENTPSPKNKKSLRLEQLQNVLPSSFATAWVSASYAAGNDGVRPFDSQVNKGPTNWRTVFGERSETAHALNVGQSMTHSSRLKESLTQVIAQYGNETSLAKQSQMTEIITKEVREQILTWIETHCWRESMTIQNLSALSDALISQLPSNNGIHAFEWFLGSEFNQLAPIEKIYLIAFFCVTGLQTDTKKSNSHVAFINDVLHPALTAHFDQIEHPPEPQARVKQTTSDLISKFPADRAEALRRLVALSPSDGLAEVDNHQIAEHFQLMNDLAQEVLDILPAELDRFIHDTQLFTVDDRERLAELTATTSCFAMLSLAYLAPIFTNSGGNAYAAIGIPLSLIGAYSSHFVATRISMILNAPKFLATQGVSPLIDNGEFTSIITKNKNEPIIKRKKWLRKFAPLIVSSAIMGSAMQLVVKQPEYLGEAVARVGLNQQRNEQFFPDNSGTSIDSDVLNIANVERPPKLGKPSFITFGIDEGALWINNECQMAYGGLACAKDFQQNETVLTVEGGYSTAAMLQKIKELEGMGYVIRMNRFEDQQSDDFMTGDQYGVPVGYRPTMVLSGPEQGIFVADVIGANIQVMSLEPNQQFAVVYEKNTNNGTATTSDHFSFYLESQIDEFLTDERFAEFPELMQLLQRAERMKQENRSTLEILEYFKSSLEDMGIIYGFASFQGDTQNPGEQFFRLFEKKNNQLIHTQWICNMFSYAIYGLAKKAELDVVMLKADVQKPNSNTGGYPAYKHMLVGFKDHREQNHPGYQVFEATLPSTNDSLPDYPSPEKNAQQPFELPAELPENFAEYMAISLATCMTLLTSHETAFRSHRKKIGQRLQERLRVQDEILSQLHGFSPISQEAVLELILTVAGVSDFSEFGIMTGMNDAPATDGLGSDWFDFRDGRMSPSESAAQQIAIRFMTRVTETNAVGTKPPEIRSKLQRILSILNQSQIRVEKRKLYVWNILKTQLLPQLREDQDRTKISKGLQLIRSQIETHYETASNFSEVQKENINQSTELLDKIISYLE